MFHDCSALELRLLWSVSIVLVNVTFSSARFEQKWLIGNIPMRYMNVHSAKQYIL